MLKTNLKNNIFLTNGRPVVQWRRNSGSADQALRRGKGGGKWEGTVRFILGADFSFIFFYGKRGGGGKFLCRCAVYFFFYDRTFKNLRSAHWQTLRREFIRVKSNTYTIYAGYKYNLTSTPPSRRPVACQIDGKREKKKKMHIIYTSMGIGCIACQDNTQYTLYTFYIRIEV